MALFNKGQFNKSLSNKGYVIEVDFSPESGTWNGKDAQVTINAYLNGDTSEIGEVYYQWSQGTFPGTSWTLVPNGGVVTLSSEGVWYLFIKVVTVPGDSAVFVSGTYKVDKTKPSINYDTTREWSDTDAVENLKSPTISHLQNGKQIEIIISE